MSSNVTSNESLEALANILPGSLITTGPPPAATSSMTRKLNVEEWLNDREVDYRRKDKVTSDGRRVWEIDCPFNSEHSRGEACIMQDESGKLSAKCHHNSCSGKGWPDFRDAIGKPDDHHWGGLVSAEPVRQGFDLNLMSSSEFESADFRENYLINNVLVEGQPCIIGGPKKCLKTGVLIDLAISLGTATPFLSHPEFDVPVRKRVCVLSGESGGFTLRAAARRICKQRGVHLREADVIWGLQLPQLANPQHLIVLSEMINEKQVDVLIVDPAYLCLLSGSDQINPANVFAMGAILSGVTAVGARTGCTIIIAHHTRKKSQNERYQPTDLDDLSMSGFAEYARQWILLGRRSEYQSDGQHELWLNIGGSAGHSSCHALNVAERRDNGFFEEHVWQIELERPNEAIRRQRTSRRESRQESFRLERLDALLATVSKHSDGETKSCLRSECRPQIPSSEFDVLIEQLIRQGAVEECEVMKNNRRERGFRPTSQSVF